MLTAFWRKCVFREFHTVVIEYQARVDIPTFFVRRQQDSERSLFLRHLDDTPAQ